MYYHVPAGSPAARAAAAAPSTWLADPRHGAPQPVAAPPPHQPSQAGTLAAPGNSLTPVMPRKERLKKTGGKGKNSTLYWGIAAGVCLLGCVAVVWLAPGAPAAAQAKAGKKAKKAPTPPPPADKPVPLSVSKDLQVLRAINAGKAAETWVVWCTDTTASTPDGTEPAPIVDQLAPLLEHVVSRGR